MDTSEFSLMILSSKGITPTPQLNERKRENQEKRIKIYIPVRNIENKITFKNIF